MVKFQTISKASRLNIDEQLYKEAKINVKKLIKIKKRDFFQENVGKPNELWKALKSQGLPSKNNPSLSSFSQRWGNKFV